MRQALVEEFENQVIDSERGRDVEVRTGMFFGGIGGDAGNVLSPMFARAEEEGQDDNALRAEFDTFVVGERNGGLGQFHVGGLDDVVLSLKALSIQRSDALQHLVAFFAFGTVIDDDDAKFHR